MRTGGRQETDIQAFCIRRKPVVGFMPTTGVENAPCKCGRVAYKVPFRPWRCECVEPTKLDGSPMNEDKIYPSQWSPNEVTPEPDENLTLNSPVDTAKEQQEEEQCFRCAGTGLNHIDGKDVPCGLCRPQLPPAFPEAPVPPIITQQPIAINVEAPLPMMDVPFAINSHETSS